MFTFSADGAEANFGIHQSVNKLSKDGVGELLGC